MSGNAAIDVAIGVVLMYAALSLFCTVINELFATVVRWRAASLQTGIVQLLDDPVLRAEFYDHGLIDANAKVSSGAKRQGTARHPSYISGKNFAMALLGSLDPTQPIMGFEQVEESIKLLPDSNIRDVLLAHVMKADRDLNKLRDGVATWFDDAMDRLGGVYKRKVKFLSFAVGLLLATALNADTLKVGNALWHDGALRERIATVATTTVSGAARATDPSSSSTASATNASDHALTFDDIRTAEAALRPLPIGWGVGVMGNRPDVWQCVQKAFGLLLTAIALTLGAPFWFDLLSKFVRIRGTGEKPARTDADSSST